LTASTQKSYEKFADQPVAAKNRQFDPHARTLNTRARVIEIRIRWQCPAWQTTEVRTAPQA